MVTLHFNTFQGVITFESCYIAEANVHLYGLDWISKLGRYLQLLNNIYLQVQKTLIADLPNQIIEFPEVFKDDLC